jgi:hypothetical protein
MPPGLSLGFAALGTNLRGDAGCRSVAGAAAPRGCRKHLASGVAIEVARDPDAAPLEFAHPVGG